MGGRARPQLRECGAAGEKVTLLECRDGASGEKATSLESWDEAAALKATLPKGFD
jgi:hypothetical protein